MYKKVYLLILIFSLFANIINSIEYFKGYQGSESKQKYSVLSMLKSKYMENNKWNENYFHDAVFPDKGITIFTNIIFSKTFIDEKGCKFNCIITFNDKEKYVFNEDFSSEELASDKNSFNIKFKNNYIKLENDVYKLHLEDSNINLTLNYKIKNEPHIFGDGIVTLDSASFMAFSQPVVGAELTGALIYKKENIKLLGNGSIGHDYSQVSPIKTPRQWRSFWLYDNDKTVLINTFILPNDKQIDRVVIYKNGHLYKSFLNCGLNSNNFATDTSTNLKYPQSFSINHTDSLGDSISANIKINGFTDKIRVFENLKPVIHSLVKMAIGEMWNYRFWTKANLDIKVNNEVESLNISGIGNFVDVIK